MEIFINLGLPKTSSTNLQTQVYPLIKQINYLGKISFRVKEKYIGSPETDKQTPLFNKLNTYVEFRNESKVNDDYISKLKDEFISFCKTSEKKILISNESWMIPYQKNNLSGKVEIISQWKKLDRLKKLVEDSDIEVKYFLIYRDPIEAIPSLYSTIHHLITDLFGRKYAKFNSFLKLFQKKNNKFNEVKLLFDVYNLNKIKEALSPNTLKILDYNLLNKHPKKFLTEMCNFFNIETDPLLLQNISTRSRVSLKVDESFLVNDKLEIYFYIKKIIPEFLLKTLRGRKSLIYLQKKFKHLRKIDINKKLLSKVLQNENII